jgi:flagellar motor switch protein FliN/FliY
MAEDPNRTATHGGAGVMEEFSTVLEIPMRVTFEVGRKSMQVREILQLAPDAVVEVGKSAGEAVDVYLNGRLVAFGEILEMENRTGVRLTDFFVQS